MTMEAGSEGVKQSVFCFVFFFVIVTQLLQPPVTYVIHIIVFGQARGVVILREKYAFLEKYVFCNKNVQILEKLRFYNKKLYL